MRRILFLDDCPARRRWAIANIPEGLVDRHDIQMTLVSTAEDAIKALSQPYDEVYLDHDLGGEVYADPSRRDTGSEVVRWIVANSPRIGALIVHTMNTPVGHAMVRELKLAGYYAKYRSFYKMAYSDRDSLSL